MAIALYTTNDSSQSLQAAQQAQNASAETTKVTSKSTTSTSSADADEVKISSTAQAKQLYKSGQTVKQISAALGMDSKTVEELLGLTEDATAALLAAATAGGGQ